MKKLIITSIVLLVAAAACGTGTTSKLATHRSSDAAQTTTPPATTASAPKPHPDGKITSDCDYILGNIAPDGNEIDHFVADGHVHNTGNIGIVVRVKASWAQAGSGPITMTKSVHVAKGKTVTVHFKRVASMTEISQYQTVDNSGTGSACGVKGTMTATFGSTS